MDGILRRLGGKEVPITIRLASTTEGTLSDFAGEMCKIVKLATSGRLALLIVGRNEIPITLTDLGGYLYNQKVPDIMAPVALKNPAKPATSLLSRIGNTPLLRLAKLDAEFPGVEIYAKAEFFNPGGSVKDRAGLNMILDGERTGRLTKDRILLDATSGNTGIAYAMICGDQGLSGEAVPAGERLA